VFAAVLRRDLQACSHAAVERMECWCTGAEALDFAKRNGPRASAQLRVDDVRREEKPAVGCSELAADGAPTDAVVREPGAALGLAGLVCQGLDARRRLVNGGTFTKSREAATPDILVFIPSLGLGLGMPVQLRSGEPTLVGARVQLTLSFPVLSFVVPIDWFPAGAGSERAQVVAVILPVEKVNHHPIASQIARRTRISSRPSVRKNSTRDCTRFFDSIRSAD
jgi:hypothetical protein